MARFGRIARRSFLIGSAAVGGGVVFGAYLYRRPLPNPLAEALPAGAAAITPFVLITAEGITLITPRADMGQGAASIQAELIAEELDVDPAAVTLSPGLPDRAYYNAMLLEEALPFAPYDQGWLAETARRFMRVPAKFMGMQITGGSSTVPDAYERLRLAGAVARETLKEAAARHSGLERSSLATGNGEVILPNGERLAYTALAEAAAAIEAVSDVELRPPAAWQRLGTRRHRIDIAARSTGGERYGIDRVLPGMLYASARRNPGAGSEPARYDASRAEAMPGVRRIVPITGGVGVIADNTWLAMRAVDAIRIERAPAAYTGDQDAIWRELEASFETEPDSRRKDEGDVEAALANPGATVIEREYRVPYLAHAPLEPLNAVVRADTDRVEIWTGTQIPGFVQDQIAGLTGLPPEQVLVHAETIGGSFGHRLDAGYVRQAVELALAVPGTPVKMTLTREADMAQEYPRPAQIARARGAVRNGRVLACDYAVASQSVMGEWFGRLMGRQMPGADASIVAGAWDQPLAIPNYRVTGYRAPAMIPVGSWRSVGASTNGFMHGAFLDELFTAAGVDPMDELIRLCSWDLARNVLERVKALSGWDGSRIDAERARGVAFTLSFGVPVAEVVEVRQTDNGIRIERVFVACEVGRVLDPVNLEAQVQGGVIFGLGHAVNCELTYENHAPGQRNFDAYPGMRMRQAPEIVVEALENGSDIRGIGEPAVPPAAAALANAVHALTGRRIRELPLGRHLRFA